MLKPLTTYSKWSGKSDKNILASALLIANELSNQSVHCSYYSCVQYVFHVLNAQFGMEIGEIERQSQSWHNAVGTHKWLRSIIFESIKNRNLVEAQKFYKNMYEMCTARNRADYNHEIVLTREAEIIKGKALSTLNFLKKHYEL